jgi:hypothetical protein
MRIVVQSQLGEIVRKTLPILKKLIRKKEAGGVAEGISPELKAPYGRKKKKKPKSYLLKILLFYIFISF